MSDYASDEDSDLDSPVAGSREFVDNVYCSVIAFFMDMTSS